jgi:hypothetical protein
MKLKGRLAGPARINRSIKSSIILRNKEFEGASCQEDAKT